MLVIFRRAQMWNRPRGGYLPSPDEPQHFGGNKLPPCNKAFSFYSAAAVSRTISGTVTVSPMERQRAALVLVSRRSVAAVKVITTMPSQRSATATSTTSGVVALHSSFLPRSVQHNVRHCDCLAEAGDGHRVGCCYVHDAVAAGHSARSAPQSSTGVSPVKFQSTRSPGTPSKSRKFQSTRPLSTCLPHL